MKDTCSISDFGRNPAKVMRHAKAHGSVIVCKNGRAEAVLVSKDRMDAILETMEILANPKAMKAIKDYEAGKVKLSPVSVLDED